MRKFTIEDVRKKFLQKNRELLETEYSNNQQRLKYRCLQCGREGTCSIVGLNQVESGCYRCNDRVKERAYTQKEIEQIYKEQGCEFLDQFKTIRDKAKYRCVCGKLDEKTVDHFLRESRCKDCGNKKISESLRVTEKEILEVCDPNGCELIDFWLQQCGNEEHKRTRIEFYCACRRIHQSWWTNFRRYPNCPKCGNARKSGKNCHLWNPNREEVGRNKSIQKKCYNLVRRTLDKFNRKKTNYKSEILGYELRDLYNRIYTEHSDFNFKQDWELDHIFPVQAFVDNKIDDMKIINHLSNLQPLSREDNNFKADKYNQQEFLIWLEQFNTKQEKK